MLYSRKNNLCIYKGSISELDQLDYMLPDVKRINFELSGIPCTIQNMQVMAKLNYPALSPILNDYNWPSAPGLTPFEHQRHMAAFMTLHPRCFNLSDMGTGKTLAALWAYDYLMRQGVVKKCLILTPLSTIYRVWENEIFTHFLSSRRCSILYGDRGKRLSRLAEDSDFYIINHDGLGVGARQGIKGLELGELGEAIRTRADIGAVIVDEGSVYKDSGTERYKVLRKVLADKPYVTWMTGTPVPVEPTNAYSQARMVRPEYKETFVGFRERTMEKISTFKWKPKDDGYKIAGEILTPAIRYARDECLDLPDVTIETFDCDLSPLQKKAYDALKKELQANVSGGQISAINEASLRLKLIQIACGAVYGLEHEVHKVDCAPRLAVLNEIIEQAGQKILIFAPLTSVVNMLYSELRKNYTVERVNGEVSAKKRNEIFAAFQEERDPRIIVADPGCMAHGLTLTQASVTIWYGPTDKPEVYQQANKRMDRPGQRNRMLIARIAATPIERGIYQRLDSRGNMQGLMLQLIKGE